MSRLSLFIVVGVLGVAAVWLWQPWSTEKSAVKGEIAGKSAAPKDADKERQAAPKEAQQAQEAPQTRVPDATPGAEFYQRREHLISKLEQAKHCQDNGECSATPEDPRAGMFEQEARLVEALQALQKLYANHQYEDEVLAAVTADYLTSPLGRVQYQALEMMQQQSPQPDNARTLLGALDDSYDSKVMELALEELQRYPQLSQSIDALLIKNLKTGSFYVSRTIAERIVPYLNQDNLGAYEATLATLPAQSAKARLLSASIERYKKSHPRD
ncbi:hypothetical protein [Lacimicrobium sp. SS2-24]|uniref:hypothetical protein n=1 Tax=Lacimicrobium sp. SS2-24 TaxID=2005569 RepID=UPI000B4B1086|nr:hypothetical protein [Lacimicrobium sp. SS2-24]